MAIPWIRRPTWPILLVVVTLLLTSARVLRAADAEGPEAHGAVQPQPADGYPAPRECDASFARRRLDYLMDNYTLVSGANNNTNETHPDFVSNRSGSIVVQTTQSPFHLSMGAVLCIATTTTLTKTQLL